MPFVMLKTVTLALQVTVRLRGIWAARFPFLMMGNVPVS